jgi:hypothetical protein
LIYFAVVFDKSENKEDENCKNSTVSISFCLLQKFRTMGGAGNGGTGGGAGDRGGEGCTSENKEDENCKNSLSLSAFFFFFLGS